MQIFGETITSKQIQEVYHNTKISVIGVLGIVTILTIVLYAEYNQISILFWATGMFIINTYRYYAYRNFSKKDASIYTFFTYLLFMSLSGLLFSSIIFFFFPDDPQYQLFLLILLTGIISAGVVQNSQTKIGVRLFLFTTLLPLIIFFLQQDTYLFHILAATLLFYFILSLKISDYLYKQYRKIQRLQEEYHNLIRNYETERQRMNHFFNYTPIGVFFFTTDFIVTYVNEYLPKNILGVPKEKLIGLKLETLKDKRLLPGLQETFKSGHGRYEGSYTTSMSNKELWIKMISSQVEVKKGEYEGVAIMVDLSELKNTQAEVEHLAYYDELTDIPKRSVIIKEITQAIAFYKREKIHSALIYFDLDKFKDINDHFGHDIGDYLLTHITKKASLAIRGSDVLARMGGDEFAILLPQLSSNKEKATLKTMEIAKRVEKYVAEDFYIETRSYNASISMGIVIIDDTMNVYDIIKASDTAMYKAKRAKEYSIVLFDTHLAKEIAKKYTLHDELIDALEGNQFVLYLQPKLTQDGVIFSAEALLRWHHPIRGLLAPDEFLEVLIEFHLVKRLTQKVMEMAHKISLSLPKEFILSINISAWDIQSDTFMEYVEKMVSTFGCSIDLELTEQIFVTNAEVSKMNMHRLHKMGFEFSLDDFGTGYASLSYLKQLPLDYLKIDKSFIDDMIDDSNDLSIVKTIIAMAHSLGLKTVAEGVENQQQYDTLCELGCDYYQGYLFSKPLPQEEFFKKLNKNNYAIQKN